jgi:hypothetical protein
MKDRKYVKNNSLLYKLNIKCFMNYQLRQELILFIFYVKLDLIKNHLSLCMNSIHCKHKGNILLIKVLKVERKMKKKRLKRMDKNVKF